MDILLSCVFMFCVCCMHELPGAAGQINSHPPVVTFNYLSAHNYAQVAENAELGTVVAVMKVSDPDQGKGGRVDCSFDYGPNQVLGLQQLDKSTYKVVLEEPVDHETRNKHTALATCQDRGQPPLSAMAVLLLDVLDVNDNAPIFFSTPEMALEENMPAGTLVGQVEAVDPDAGLNGEVVYHLFPEHTDLGVTIDTHTGQIHTTRPFDWEVTHSVQFTVVAKDRGQPPMESSTTVTLTILDVDDNAP